ncbi:unnamed protein product [Ambrosiozyma monospora]|uniref:Unnamed protein product n=1 Tax=Ambrosiozyma monospora TaxID=43982 RepID=A0A9W7DKY5_AMBMO|nr:unnamed protein product [Ambrosiozyma monospora]
MLSFNSFLSDLEIGVNVTLDATLSLLNRTIGSILNTQQNNDFYVFAGADLGNQDKTTTCGKLLDFMEFTLRTLDTALQDNSLLKYEFVARVAGLLLESLIYHFTKFPVSSYGSSIVTQDVFHYINLFEEFKFVKPESDNDGGFGGLDDDDDLNDGNELKDSFAVLKELANLFSCQPVMLKELSNEGRLQFLRRSIIRDYIKRRLDFKPQYLVGV